MPIKNFFLIQFMIINFCFGMDDDPEKPIDIMKYQREYLPSLISDAIRNNDKHKELQIMFNEFLQNQPTKSGKRKSPSEIFFKEAAQAANENLYSTEKQLKWWPNTSRIKLAGSGVAAMALGLAKGGYDIFLFTEEDTNTIENIFSTFADGTLFAGGYLALRIAWQNSTAKSEYQKAQMIKFVITTMAEKQEPSPQEENDILADLEGTKKFQEKLSIIHEGVLLSPKQQRKLNIKELDLKDSG